MNEDINKRLSGLELIINSLKESSDLCSYLIYVFHKEFNVFENNYAISFIIRTLIEQQIMGYYKLMKSSEKHSFQKLINIANTSIGKPKITSLQNELSKLDITYSNSSFEKIRSKFLAHLDINLTSEKSDLISIITFSSNCIDYYNLLCKEFGYKKSRRKNIINSFDEILNNLRQLESVKAHCYVNFIKKKRTVKINELTKIFKQSYS